MTFGVFAFGIGLIPIPISFDYVISSLFFEERFVVCDELLEFFVRRFFVVEDVCFDFFITFRTAVFDNEEAARERFKSLVKEDKKFLAEEGRNDTIEESEDSYCSFPDGEYSTTHYWVSLLKTKHA